MYAAILALDNSNFKHFDYTVQMIQQYPTSLQADKTTVINSYPRLLEIALTINERTFYQRTAEEILSDIQKLHAEYLEIMAAFELAERGEQHEAPTTNTARQTYCEASGGYGQNADMAL